MFQGCGDICDVGDSHRVVTDLLFSINETLLFICSLSVSYFIYKQSITKNIVVFIFQVQRWLERIYILCTEVSKESSSGSM